MVQNYPPRGGGPQLICKEVTDRLINFDVFWGADIIFRTLLYSGDNIPSLFFCRYLIASCGKGLM